MAWLETGLRTLHIVFGFVGLAAYWVPILSRKGGPSHVRYGTIFSRCAWVVLASAGLTVLYKLTALAQAGVTFADRPASYAFLVVLGYLSFVTWVILRHALGVLRHKADPAALATPANRLLARAAIAASVALIVFALWLRPPNMIVLLALSPVGIGSGSGILRYLGQEQTSPRQWLYEHLGGMIGAGIAFHTAFAVFGFARLFDYRPEGLLGVLPWILPAAIGIPASVIWTRYYQRRFGELPGRAAAG
jgi:hypothetical protein